MDEKQRKEKEKHFYIKRANERKDTFV